MEKVVKEMRDIANTWGITGFVLIAPHLPLTGGLVAGFFFLFIGALLQYYAFSIINPH